MKVFGFDKNGIAAVTFGEVQNLPEPEKDTIYIVSALVASACHARKDAVWVICPNCGAEYIDHHKTNERKEK